MKRVLLTGMSGTGKSSVIERLRRLGYHAVDLDQPQWSVYDSTGDWVWREDRVQELLEDREKRLLFVSGCATNQVKFHDQFDLVILLSAPRDVIVERVRSRTNNDYGKRPGELEEILFYLDTVEPRLRRIATHELDTRPALPSVVRALLELVEPGGDPARCRTASPDG